MYTVIQITIHIMFIFSLISKVFCRFFMNERAQKERQKERKKILLLEFMEITLYDV